MGQLTAHTLESCTEVLGLTRKGPSSQTAEFSGITAAPVRAGGAGTAVGPGTERCARVKPSARTHTPAPQCEARPSARPHPGNGPAEQTRSLYSAELRVRWTQ